MKKLIFIHGPNGVGKSTLCKLLHERLENSAWLESEWCRNINPFVLNEEIEALTEKNMTHMLRSYLECSMLDYVILNWGFHGSRKSIFERVLSNLSGLDYSYVPITITCSEEENVKRMLDDGRDEERVRRALRVRCVYDDLPFPRIDTTDLSAEETASRVIHMVMASTV